MSKAALDLELFCLKTDKNKYLQLGEALITSNIGKAFSLLSFGLSLDESKRQQYYILYFNVLESWSNILLQDSRYEDVLKVFDVAQDLYPQSPDLKYLLAYTLFRECFGGQGAHYFDEVWPILVAVDQGVKPSFLWDVCTPDTNALLSLLQIAWEKELISHNLKVVEVDLDVFIVNMSSLIRVLTNILTSDDSWLMDISASEPKIASKDTHFMFRHHLISLLSQLGISDSSIKEMEQTTGSGRHPECSSSVSNTSQTDHLHSIPSSSSSTIREKAITVQFPEEVNLSTIFGCMLGYPQIYWWQGESGGNSLSGVPLKVFKFGAAFSPISSQVELFSFSIPEALEDELRPGIEHWGNVVNVWVGKSASYSDTQFFCDPVLCLSVAL